MEIRVKGCEPFNVSGIRADVDRVVNLPVNFQVAGTSATMLVNAAAATVDVRSTVGNLISSNQAVDLPLNGRNVTHLGLLQPGVAPLTFGLLEAGGIARANSAMDARSFFAASTEPFRQDQFALTLGGPIRHDHDFFFAYHEGQRAIEGETRTTVRNSHRQPIPGQFGNEGRKAIRGPGLVSADLSTFKKFRARREVEAMPPRLLQLALKYII